MKYHVLKYKYLTEPKYNLGDNIQTIAAMHMLTELGIGNHDIGYLNRDELANPRDMEEPGILVAQGWFGLVPDTYPLPISHSNIAPLYFGFHLNEGSWEHLSENDDFIASMKKAEPVGCRDYGTRDFLRSLGISAFFSGCLTMSLPSRGFVPAEERLYLIDAPSDVLQHIPEKLTTRATVLNQEGYFPSGETRMDDTDMLKIDQMAYERLEELRNCATLVATKRIHIALPCLAMGIPTIFCFNQPDNPRVSLLRNLLPIYDNIRYGNIDWTPSPPDLSKIKKQMKLLFAYRLQTLEKKVFGPALHLSLEDAMQAESILKLACEEDRGEEIYSKRSYSRSDFINSAFTENQQQQLRDGIPLVLFGAGSAGVRLAVILSFFGINPTCFCDNNSKVLRDRTLPIIDFHELLNRHKRSLIFIATPNGNDEISKQLLNHGFSRENIIENAMLISKYAHFVPPEGFSKNNPHAPQSVPVAVPVASGIQRSGENFAILNNGVQA